VNPTAIVIDLGVVAAQAVVLYVLSQRVLLRLVIGTVAAHGRGRVGRFIVNLLRFPGNLLHESSHAAGYLLSGYRIRRLTTCVTDPQGRGYCEPGGPWSPIHWMPLAAAFAALLPLFVGALVMRELGVGLGVPLPEADVTGERLSPVVAAMARSLPGFVAGLNWRAWQTYLFWYLALSIGAELAPSDVDLRKGGPVILAALALLVLGLYAMPHMEMRPENAAIVYGALRSSLRALSNALFAGMVGCGIVGVVGGLAALLVRAAGRR
jgi:hypothetical protein